MRALDEFSREDCTPSINSSAFVPVRMSAVTIKVANRVRSKALGLLVSVKGKSNKAEKVQHVSLPWQPRRMRW